MSRLSRTLARRAARDEGKMHHVPGPHKTKNIQYFMKAKARRRRISEIANESRKANRI